MIQPIVEGHGEGPAVPVLLRKIAQLMAVPRVEVGKPIRRPRSELVTEPGLTRAIELALLKPGCQAVFILFDADDDCPKTLAPQLQNWAATAARGTAVAVVLANREYEGWFLHALPSLVGARSITDGTPCPTDPETIRGAKERLASRMSHGGYSEIADQTALIQQADWLMVHLGSRSGRKLIREVRRLFTVCQLQPSPWPEQV